VIDDLISWLRSVWDDEERTALAVPEGRRSWHVDGGSVVAGHPTDEVVDWVHDEGAAEHIALHDPARVLRRIEADRRILDEYQKALDRRRRHPEDLAAAGALLQMVRVIKLMAESLADHPGYREEWKP
jgi:hypothetical protein